MKILERNPQRVTLEQQTRLAALLSLIMTITFANLAWRLSEAAPPQQTYLMMGLTVFLAYLFYQSMKKTTITIDLTNQRLNWRHRSLLRSRQENFDFRELAQARVDTRRHTHGGRARIRSRVELVFHDPARKAPFALTPHHLPGPGAQQLADEINTALARHRR